MENTILEQIDLRAKGFNLETIAYAVMKHARLSNFLYPLQGHVRPLSNIEAHVYFPSEVINQIERVAKITGTKGNYRIERYTLFPSGRELSGFNPREYVISSLKITILQYLGLE